MRAERSQSGLTLIELMVALVIVSIAIAAAFGFGWSVMNAYKDQQISNKVSRAARGSLDVIAHAIRGGSPGVPTGNLEDLVGCSGSGGVNVINNTANGTDELSIIYSSGGVLNTLRQPFQQGHNEIRVYDASKFRQGDLVVVTNFQQGHIMEVSGTNVTADLSDSDEILLTSSPSGSGCVSSWPATDYNKGDIVVRAKVARFFVDTSVAGRPALIMDPDNDPTTNNEEPLALGVEDMQIAIGVDDRDLSPPTTGPNPDGEVTEVGAAANDDEWYHNVPGELTPPMPWRALRVTLVARSVQERSTTPISTPLVLEDHDPGAPADEFRRRAVHAIIELRNMEQP